MNSSFIESVQEFHKIVDIHCTGPLLSKFNTVQDLIDNSLDVKVVVHHLVLQRAMDLVVLLQHDQDGRLRKGRTQGLVLPYEGNTSEAVPFSEIDRRWRIARLDSNHTRLNFWRRLEIVLADFHEVVDASQQLSVDGETAVKLVTRLGDQSLGKLALKYKITF